MVRQNDLSASVTYVSCHPVGPLAQWHRHANAKTTSFRVAHVFLSTRRTRNPKFVQTDRKGASGQIHEICYWLIFSRTRLLKWLVGGFWRTMAQITRIHGRKCFFSGPRDGRPHLGVKFPQNRQNLAWICTAERLSCASMKIDVIEELRHWRRSLWRCQHIFDDHCQTYATLLPNSYQKCQVITHPHWPKQATYAFLCMFSSMNLEISAVIILWFLFGNAARNT